MVEINDRRRNRPDFANGSNTFSFDTHGDKEITRWSQMPPTSTAKREVHQYYKGQKGSQTWQEANRLASRRTRRSGGVWDDSTTTDNYAAAYQDNLIRVLSQKGPHLAKRYGEVVPGR